MCSHASWKWRYLFCLSALKEGRKRRLIVVSGWRGAYLLSILSTEARVSLYLCKATVHFGPNSFMQQHWLCHCSVQLEACPNSVWKMSGLPHNCGIRLAEAARFFVRTKAKWCDIYCTVFVLDENLRGGNTGWGPDLGVGGWLRLGGVFFSIFFTNRMHACRVGQETSICSQTLTKNDEKFLLLIRMMEIIVEQTKAVDG